ncbi:MAG: extracellular solute-binding protein [Lachnoclostridium sp.]|nr:extracellular solute-binding protein [Lachnospira sp.]MCM1248158.1 extracellular solute-binding protein [Lachnoclostridium sp.]MCM1534444.1 extracellular solute-binding protein [Clostridium sp.]
MWKRADLKTILMGLSALFMTVLLSACGRGDSEEIPEKVFEVAYSQEQEFPTPVQVACNSHNAWVITIAKKDPIYKWTPQTSGVEQLEWQLEDGNHDLISIAERRGTLYVETRNRESGAFDIYEYYTDGTWRTIMSAKVKDWEMYTVMGSGFYVDGSENVYLVGGNKVLRFSGEGQESGAWELQGDVCLWMEDGSKQMECVTATADEIILYELAETGAERKWTREATAGVTHGIRTGSEETLCLATDGEILFLDRESGSPMARIDTMKLGVSSVLSGYYDESERTLRLYGSVGNGDGLCYSLLSERDASGEQRIELVYGMVGGVNKGETSSIWRAIAAFNQSNQDYYVTIKNYDNNVERLHADMAAGNGPDIIDMTHSEYYESYVKNGYLEDLSPYLEQSQYKDDIIWNILDVYRIDNGLYLFAPQVRLKGVVIHPEYENAVEEWNLKTFLDMVERNGWEKTLFGGSPGDPETLLLCLLKGSQDELIDWEQGETFFNTEEFVDMLELCRKYAKVDWSDAETWTSEERRHNALCQEVQFGGWFFTYLNYVSVYGREYPVYGYPTLSGQTYEVPGFPIRGSVLKELAEESKDMKVRIGGEMLMITDAEIQILEDIIYNGELSNGMFNPDILSVIKEETASYFNGDKSAWDVAHIIQNRVKLILQE